MPSTFNPNTVTSLGLGKQARALLRQGRGVTTLTATVRRLAKLGLVEITDERRLPNGRVETSFIVTDAAR